ncbi:MAG: transketolase C-terminal domain-containing protein [Pseudomonadota bacterium]
MRKTFIQVLTDIAYDNDDIYIVAGDAGFGVFEDFCRLKPDRFINAGIAEANMIGYGAGLCMAGFNVFVYNIIPFVLYRCYEQVRNDICYQRLPVTLVGIGSGLTYAPGGMTHYGVEDLSICQSLPNLTVISPIDPVETKAAIEYAAVADGPVYIRIAKAGEPTFRTDGCPNILTPALVRDGEGVAVLSYGSVFAEAVQAMNELAMSGIYPRLISVPTLQPFPEEELFCLLKDCHVAITLEEHYRSGGLFTRLADCLAKYDVRPKLVPLALPDRFIHDINKQEEMRKEYDINAAAVVKTVKTVLCKKSLGGKNVI